ncbi:PadR family transcriptional regulator [Lacticaseibacillus nasuensis]|uniref:PadR family transcriptional regulator n=1 Tax=Lacticaseibacillus nasuensis TaxID=944671 RepID=UPI00224678F5|nr:PadR family transcriptional regulator [Lacticaseibacillus nasuensis]MCX2454621.1 PadR family transcriptional regulator [Lacticaseibacillus nasuensis]
MRRLPSQLLKGSLAGALLQVIANRETYAYEIHQALVAAGFGEIADGTIYPLLLKLEKANQISGEKRASPNGEPPRKYYHLLPAGQAALAEFEADWTQLATAMRRLKGAQGSKRSQAKL